MRVRAPGEPDRQPDEVAHEVEITRGFYLGKYEVTQGQWSRLMHRNPSQFAACGPRCPVENVRYDDIQAFLRELARRSPGERFRLPTEAEWEYACWEWCEDWYGDYPSRPVAA